MHAVYGIAHAHGALGVPMVAAHGGEEMAPFCAAQGYLVLDSHLEGHFHGNRAGICKEEVGEAFRNKGEYAPCKCYCWSVGKASEHHVAHAGSLGLQGAHNVLVSVAVHCAPPGGHAINELLAVFKQDTVFACGLDPVYGQGIGGRGVGVPQMLPVKGKVRIRFIGRSPKVAHPLRNRGKARDKFVLARSDVPSKVGNVRKKRNPAFFAKGFKDSRIVVEDALLVLVACIRSAPRIADIRRLCAVQNHAHDFQAPKLQGLNAQARLIEAAKPVAHHKEHRKIQLQHEVQHGLVFVDGNVYAPCPFHYDRGVGLLLGLCANFAGKVSTRKMRFDKRQCQMRGTGWIEAVQCLCPSAKAFDHLHIRHIYAFFPCKAACLYGFDDAGIGKCESQGTACNRLAHFRVRGSDKNSLH